MRESHRFLMNAWELEELAKNEGNRKKRNELRRLARQARDEALSWRDVNPEYTRLRRITFVAVLVIFGAVIMILGAVIL